MSLTEEGIVRQWRVIEAGNSETSVPELSAGKVVSRVYRTIVETDFVVQMRRGAPPGCAYIADNLILANLLAGFNIESREVPQAGGQTITMIDDDQVSIGRFSLCVNNF